MSEPLSGSGTAVALGGATVFGLFTGTDFGIVFGAFAGALFVATMPQALSAWRVAAHFLVSFIIGVLGAEVLASWLVKHTGFDGAPVDALCAVLVSVVSVKINVEMDAVINGVSVSGHSHDVTGVQSGSSTITSKKPNPG
ncbi:membrane protein [Escherichia coli]|uniref:putative holin n=3 Tax=Escherichia coli TaxID=562 RepID=UPI0010B966DA|nr:putative holin [Escherichia coli]GCI61695.1 membrane protein [Escherichia coli]